jgi:hypothetical protein
MSDQEAIFWPRVGADGGKTKFEVINNLGAFELEISRRSLILNSKTSTPSSESSTLSSDPSLNSTSAKQIVVGGGRFQADGPDQDAGFDSIHSLIPLGDYLLVADGAWVRKVEMTGAVTTWGGKPLGEVARRERPFLLGMAAVQGKEIAFQDPSRSGREVSSPAVLVCDFSLRRVIWVQENNAKEVFRSEPGWSPTGIWIDDSDIYLLEYRAYLVRAEEYLRILRFEGLDFGRRPTVVVSLPRGEASADFT